MSSPTLTVKALIFLSDLMVECAPISTAMPETQMHVTVLLCLLVPARVVLCNAVTGHSQKTYIDIPC